MAEETFVQEGVDRVQDAVRNMEKEARRLQKRVQTQRRSLERRVSAERKRAEKRVSQLVKDLRKNDVVKRVEAFQKDASRQVERQVENLLGAFQIASKSDVRRIDRKLSQLNKKLREIEKSKSGSARAA